MAVVLIVEDGSGVTGANTFASLAVYNAYADARGVEFDDDDVSSVNLIKAMDFLYGQSWKGIPVSPFQPLSFPRKYVYVDGVLWDSTMIPADVINAQCVLAMLIAAGVDVAPTVDNAVVTEETVGPITTKYSDKYGLATGAPNMPQVTILLSRWTESTFLRTVRA